MKSSQWRSVFFALVLQQCLLSGCGQGDEPGMNSAGEDGGRVTPDESKGPSARDASVDGRVLDASQREDARVMSPHDVSASAVSGASDAATRHPDPAMIVTGMTRIDGALAVAGGTFKPVGGFMYYDPVGIRGEPDPALKVILTSWPVDSCDPESIWNARKDAEGRYYVACYVFEYRPPGPSSLLLQKGTANGYVSEGGDLECVVRLTQGSKNGQERAVGEMEVSVGATGADIGTVSFAMDYCGTIDTSGNI